MLVPSMAADLAVPLLRGAASGAKHQKATQSPGLLDLPPEISLHILSYLDLPELCELARLSPELAALTSDPILHSNRLWVVSPSRINHHLFGRSPEGHSLRPTVGDLVQRGVMKGFGIDRRWRRGLYLYSLDSIVQYENGLALCKRHAQHILSVQLRRRIKPASPKSASFVSPPVLANVSAVSNDSQGFVASAAGDLSAGRFFGNHLSSPETTTDVSGLLKHSKSATSTNPFKAYLLTLHSPRIFPDIESSSPAVARSLLPVMRRLKWCLQRDSLAREFKNSGRAVGGFGTWLDGQSIKGKEKHDKENMKPDLGNPMHHEENKRIRKRVFVESEQLRLAVCPDVKKRVGFYEKLGQDLT
ncbi:hypothetical protein CPB83DRAFT_21320 [Crepidotus variabilis]|uniref:F-box domain-containing protein n=1 Tax=Crepidotus variabilis TaxID=179855 RepID=A0A9P6JX64_9AGAR|nr:hypothetical protein CPB83DRAFT_21320 [Crepidotus variabilis]